MAHTQPSERQTLSYLRTLFEERGIGPKSKLGQNFLIDLNLLDVLLRAAELGPEDLALEIGSGTGSLTARLAEQAGAVVSVEVDPAFAALTVEAVQGHDNVVLLHADVLKNKNEINPAVPQAVEALARQRGTTRLKLVANLPYAVAVPVISNLLLGEMPLERMVVTAQWEIAERLMAGVGTKAFGALAVLVQSLAGVELVRRLPPSVFWPRPQVWSAMVCIPPAAAGWGTCPASAASCATSTLTAARTSAARWRACRGKDFPSRRWMRAWPSWASTVRREPRRWTSSSTCA
jgi:16S rRNA (adenine1518-N6/adenine1519-N6)-dimethyltransferase